ncbi:hypothetical protein B0H15DRAFT_956093 [Mycena belliarum]|uniref:Uncharacterized protein n=1 Tax=Mycena belliarum TaxID=1033014 RepID=A0AAD6TQ23_9AGAR|nr:hypothetical protein B0H15DRAFT_956093 [Mycena belliae]
MCDSLKSRPRQLHWRREHASVVFAAVVRSSSTASGSGLSATQDLRPRCPARRRICSAPPRRAPAPRHCGVPLDVILGARNLQLRLPLEQSSPELHILGVSAPAPAPPYTSAPVLSHLSRRSLAAATASLDYRPLAAEPGDHTERALTPHRLRSPIRVATCTRASTRTCLDAAANSPKSRKQPLEQRQTHRELAILTIPSLNVLRRDLEHIALAEDIGNEVAHSTAIRVSAWDGTAHRRMLRVESDTARAFPFS